MMPSLALGAAAAFVLVLLLLRSREEVAIGGVTAGNRNGTAGSLQPAELAILIFSHGDREFIRRTRSRRLQRLFAQERRKVALHWVWRTSEEVSQIMRNHRLSSRQSTNLNVAAEMKLSFQYFELRLLCGLLLLLIQLFGPHVLLDVAAKVGEIYQRIGRELPHGGTASQVASPENLAAS